MARPNKEGLEYFSVDVDISDDPKIEYIEAVHGLLGYGLLMKILPRIYRNGYYINWTDRDLTLFARKINVDINQVNVIINDCLEEGIFDKKIFNQYKILTSRGIQKRYLMGCARRTEVKIIKEYQCVEITKDLIKSDKIVIENINGETVNIFFKNDDNNSDNVDRNTLKEKKGNKKKVKINTLSNSEHENILKLWNEFAIVQKLPKCMKLTPERDEILSERLSEKEFDFKNILDEVKNSTWLLGKGKTRFTLSLDWIIKDQTNYIKILEGNFRDGNESDKEISNTGRRTGRELTENNIAGAREFLERAIGKQSGSDSDNEGVYKTVPT